MHGVLSNLGRVVPAWFFAVRLIAAVPDGSALEELAPGLLFVPGPVNGVVIERAGKRLAVYGDPREVPVAVDTVLFTHHLRDVVWAGLPLLAAGAKAVAPTAELEHFTQPDRFWADFETKRFHDYSQQTSRVVREPIRVAQAVRSGDTISWQDLAIRVLHTPGYTRGAATYLLDLDGRRLAFTGDLIYGDGRLLDLYSLQDAIPAAKIGGYHGYAARLADVLTGLDKVAAEKPHLIVPARGPVIRNPDQAISKLRERIRVFYANYLSIDALRWYFKDDHIRAKASRVLGPEAMVDWMPMADTVQPLPDWIIPITNARLVLSADKTGFLIDCGSQRIIEELKKLQAEGRLGPLEHLFITHYHDDHTDQAAQLVQTFGCKVHASRQNRDILENPAAYRLPCLTPHPIRVTAEAESGARWRWKEFELTLYYFPGQTLHHDALLVKRDRGEQIFFIGDSFTPSGIDDYCLLNRNFLHESMGYFYCLDLVRRQAPQALLVNQHVEPLFRFSDTQLTHIRTVLQERVELLQNLLPWDNPNFGLDEGWARFYPYAQESRPGQTSDLSLRIMNHSPVERTFTARLHLPPGWTLLAGQPGPARIAPRTEGTLKMQVVVPGSAAARTHLLTADLHSEGLDLREWTEAMVTVVTREPGESDVRR